jgi:hypothetical protein
MKSAKSFLKQIDEIKFQSTIESVIASLKEATTEEQLYQIVEYANIESYKKKKLLEYIDQNKDKLLSLSTYNEGDPVVMSDDYEPHAGKHGKVISRGEALGTIKVKFEDGEYDVPEHHITRKDAVASEQKVEEAPATSIIAEHKCLVLLESGKLAKVILESLVDAEALIAEQIGEGVLLVFPEVISESFVAEISEAEMTDAQKDKREEIVMALKKNKEELKKKYGDRWESVMYAIATKKAMEESLEEASRDVVFKQHGRQGLVKIVRDENGYYTVEMYNSNNEMVDSQEFSDFKDAETAAHLML